MDVVVDGETKTANPGPVAGRGRHPGYGSGSAGESVGGVGVEVVEVADVVDAVAKALALDFTVLDPATLAELVPVMEQVLNQMQALDASYVRALDRSGVWARRGHANPTAMLRTGSNAHPAVPAGRARRARRLPKMRNVQEAFAAGAITVDHVRVLGELTTRRWRCLFADAEPYLVKSAEELSWREFAHVIDIWKTAADPTEPDKRDQADRDAREFHLSRSFNDRGIANGVFTPEARIIVTAELDRITALLLHHDRQQAIAEGIASPKASDLERTPAQRRHDAIVIMAQRSAGADPSSGPGDPVIHVRVTKQCLEAAAETVAGLKPARVAAADWECEFDDGTPMSYAQLMRHVIAANIFSVVLSQDDAVLHYGTGRRWFTKHQKGAVAYRDRICGCGCGLLARYCDIDHQIEAADGGPTDIENGHPLCRRSHNMKTEQNKTRRRQQRQQREQEQRQDQDPQQQEAQDQQRGPQKRRPRDVGNDPDPPPRPPQEQQQRGQEQERQKNGKNRKNTNNSHKSGHGTPRTTQTRPNWTARAGAAPVDPK